MGGTTTPRSGCSRRSASATIVDERDDQRRRRPSPTSAAPQRGQQAAAGKPRGNRCAREPARPDDGLPIRGGRSAPAARRARRGVPGLVQPNDVVDVRSHDERQQTVARLRPEISIDRARAIRVADEVEPEQSSRLVARHGPVVRSGEPRRSAGSVATITETYGHRMNGPLPGDCVPMHCTQQDRCSPRSGFARIRDRDVHALRLQAIRNASEIRCSPRLVSVRSKVITLRGAK